MSGPDYERWVALREYLHNAAFEMRGDAQVSEWVKAWTRQIDDKLTTSGQSYRVCSTCNRGGHHCPGCGADVRHGEIACDECSGRTAHAIPPWNPDFPGCAPEECGGSRLDPCSWVMRTQGRAHDDDLTEEMLEAGFDPQDDAVRRAVMEAGSVTHYQAEKESSEFAKEIEPREISVSQLVTGDSVYSPSTDTWHEVRRATSGQLYFQRNGAWRPVAFAADVKFLTRRGYTGAVADRLFMAFGGEVIEG